MKWICCQLGARESYAIPRALFRVALLECLLTDAWFPPYSLLARIFGQKSKLAERFHDELSDARVKAFSSSLVLFETLTRARGLAMWPSILARNQWFQRKVANALTSDFRFQTSDRPVFLSYSYTALEPFRYAKSRGWKTVLAQIDPGPEEIDRRLAATAAEPPSPGRAQRLAVLQRRRSTIDGLLTRRDRVANTLTNTLTALARLRGAADGTPADIEAAIRDANLHSVADG